MTGATSSNNPTLLDIVTLAIAVLGFGLAVASLVWQIASFKLSGPRVHASIGFGIATAGFELGPDVLVIEASNDGRADAEVTSWAIMLPDKRTLWPSMNPNTFRGRPVPLTLAAGHGETWYALIAPIVAEMRGAGFGAGTPLRATVMLGTGDRVVSKDSVKL